MMSWLLIIGAVVTAAIIVQYFMDQVYIDTTYKYVLITGCDSGFGRLLVGTLGKCRGCKVIAACLKEESMAQITQETKSVQSTVIPIQLDVTNSESIKLAYDKVKGIIPQRQGLWGLVNNAGINLPKGPYHWLTRHEIDRIIQVNFLGTVEVTSTFLPLLQQAGGRVVNMSSCCTLLPSIETAYAASKAAVEAYSDNLRVSMRRQGISVHIIQPGAFKTGISDPENILQSNTMLWERLSQDERDQYGGIEKLQRNHQIIRKVLQFASPKLHLVTEAIEHALCARWPWRHYLPGLDSKLFCKPLSLLPACVTDFLMSLLTNNRQQ